MHHDSLYFSGTQLQRQVSLNRFWKSPKYCCRLSYNFQWLQKNCILPLGISLTICWVLAWQNWKWSPRIACRNLPSWWCCHFAGQNESSVWQKKRLCQRVSGKSEEVFFGLEYLPYVPFLTTVPSSTRHWNSVKGK